MSLKELKEKMQAALLAAKAICDAAEEAKRDFTDDERQKVAGYLTEAKQWKEKIKTAEGDDALRKAVLDLGAGLDIAGNGGDQPAVGAPGALKGATVGAQFVNAPTFKAWMKQIAPGGRVPDGARGLNSPPIEFKSLLGLGPTRKELIVGSDDASAGAFVEIDYTRIYEAIGRAPLNLRTLVTIRQTTSDLVHFVRQVTQVTQAEPVPEANVTEYSGATGEVSGEKPEGVSEWLQVTEPVKTIAVWIPATKRALSDVAQIRGIIDSELRDDLAEEFESQILNGNGVGENFTGLLNTAGVLAQAWDTDMLTTTRKAITSLLVTGRTIPTAWVMHPADWETIDLLQDEDGRYYYGGPIRQGVRTHWGYPVVQNVQMAEGSALLGDWRKAVVWDRERANIQVSDSHADFFIRNMVAILAEMRAAFGVIRPSGFILVDLTAGS